VFLAALPRWVILLAVLVVVIAGLFLPGVAGAVMLIALAGLLGWLLAVAWPVLTVGARLFRVATIVLVLAYAAWKGVH